MLGLGLQIIYPNAQVQSAVTPSNIWNTTASDWNLTFDDWNV